MADFIKKIKAGTTTSAKTYDIYSVSADTCVSAMTAQSAKTAVSLAGITVSTGGNFEINSCLAEYPTEEAKTEAKLNLVSDNAIQIKPGNGEPLQLDTERAADEDKDEFGIKTCCGTYEKAKRVVGLKLNTAEVTLDTQKANTEVFDVHSMDVKFRYDKWNGGLVSGSTETGPIYAKMKARAFDFRCYDHGGIALQIAGQDSDNCENKIKFESDRISALGVDVPEYCKEGGKGLEFGTFNNEHTSLYTRDYRFKGDAKVMGVSRIISATTEKTDYATQNDDFKDVLPAGETGATWNEIINVARQYADGNITGGSGGGSADMSNYATTAALQTVSTTASSALANANEALGRANGVEASAATAMRAVFRKEKNGNLEISAEGMYQYTTENDPSTEGYSAAAVYYVDVTEYNEAKGTELTEEAFAALSDDEKIKTAAIAATAATLDFVSDGKIALKGSELSFEAGNIIIPVEISKKGKVTVAGVDLDGNIDTAATPEVAKAKLAEGLNISFNVEKSNLASVAATYPEGSNMISVSLATLLGLVDRVTALEARVNALENPTE